MRHQPSSVLLLLSLTLPAATDPARPGLPEKAPIAEAVSRRWSEPPAGHALPADELWLTVNSRGEAELSADVTPSLTLRTAALRQGDVRVDLPAAPPTWYPDHIDVEQGPVTSWWQRSPAGLEQGWTIERPLSVGTLSLEVHLNLPLQVDGRTLRAGSPQEGFVGTHLAAWDARGEALAVDAVAIADGVELRVEVDDAVWPVTIDPIWQPWTWHRAGSDTWGYGHAVALDGDVNGDGYADALVSAPEWSNGRDEVGRVWLYLGGPAGLSTHASVAWTGTQHLQRFGSAAAFVGDLNGDGLDDVVIGADGHDDVDRDEGAIFAYLGSTGVMSTVSQVTITGRLLSRRLGGALAAAGDVNGDGYADVVAGSGPSGTAAEGVAAVWFGSPSGLSPRRPRRLLPTAAHPLFGARVAGLGDLNGDGMDEVAVSHGDPAAPHLNLYRGRVNGSSVRPDRTLNDTLPYVITSGYYNSDNHRDLLTRSSAGLVVWWGSRFGPSSQPDPLGFGTGTWSAATGDMNDDGFDDVLLGGPSATPGEGRVELLWGDFGGFTQHPLVFWDGEIDDARFGGAISMGDVDGDFWADGLIGASGRSPDDSTSAFGRGHTFLIRGGPLGPAHLPPTSAVPGEGGDPLLYGDVDGDGRADAVLIGASSVSWAFGTPDGISNTWQELPWPELEYRDRVPAICDIDGDGDGDLLLPSWTINAAGARVNALHLWTAEPAGLTGPVTELLSLFAVAEFERVQCAGDVDGDGIDDVVVSNRYGSPGYRVWFGGPAGPTPASVRLLEAPGFRLAGWPDHFIAAGDLNGDGLADLAAGFEHNEEVHLLLGRPGGPNPVPDVQWVMAPPHGERGVLGLASAGDVDADGFDDLLIANILWPSVTEINRVYLMRGNTLGITGQLDGGWTPLEPGAGLDTSLLRGVGDLDGDGYDDVAIGERMGPHDEPWSSLLAVYRGGATGLELTPWFQAPWGIAPSKIDPAGDVDGDGRDDMLISMHDAHSCPTETGVWLFRGGQPEPVPAPPVP